MQRREFVTMAGLVGLGGAAAVTKAHAAPETSSTMDQIRSSGKLRIAGIPGQPPGFTKDITTNEWGGAYFEMARDAAKELQVELEVVETTWGNTVADLQANKIDIAFALSPTPARALAIQFTSPLYRNPYGILVRKGYEAATWVDINKEGVKIAVEQGTSDEAVTRAYAPNATITAIAKHADAVLSVQSGRNDLMVTSTFRAMGARQKNPDLDAIFPKPTAFTTVATAIRYDSDWRFREFMEAWIEYNAGRGAIRNWMLDSLKTIGFTEADLPEDLEL